MPIIQFLNPARDSIKVSAYSRKVLLDIMKISGIAQITITSTARTAHDQARIMFENIERHGVAHQKNLYGAYGNKVIDEYSALKTELPPTKVGGLAHSVLMTKVINRAPS